MAVIEAYYSSTANVIFDKDTFDSYVFEHPEEYIVSVWIDDIVFQGLQTGELYKPDQVIPFTCSSNLSNFSVVPSGTNLIFKDPEGNQFFGVGPDFQQNTNQKPNDIHLSFGERERGLRQTSSSHFQTRASFYYPGTDRLGYLPEEIIAIVERQKHNSNCSIRIYDVTNNNVVATINDVFVVTGSGSSGSGSGSGNNIFKKIVKFPSFLNIPSSESIFEIQMTSSKKYTYLCSLSILF